MGSKICMNEACRATASYDWKKGWTLKSGGLALLCYNCGSAYQNSIFCETFHSEDSGWRPCGLCGKIVHCGCIASRHLHEYMDLGGVACISCTHSLEIHAGPTIQIPSDVRNGPKSTTGDPQPATAVENGADDDKFSTERLMQLTKSVRIGSITAAFEQLKHPELPHILKPPASPTLPSVFFKPDLMGPRQGVKDMPDSVAQPCLNFSLLPTPPLAGPGGVAPFPGGIVEGSDRSKGSLQKVRHIPAKPPKPGVASGPETSREGGSQMVRFPRQPVEGRGRSQLLPRYWPRITDQELQQLSGDLNSTIVPLFEKILSASDAGRIGRLVLPKACAEAYFPTINQSEGIPIKIQDIKGKEWTFQFRFWPNNNSRMYVLEGVTPCIQSMQVQAGDTVIFSRRDPGRQLVIGCRKATTNVDPQEPQTPAIPNIDPAGDTSSSGGGNDNLLANGGRVSDDSSILEKKKKARNIKKKRLHMHDAAAVELRITWEEAQELLRPPPSTEPTVVMVEDHEFEEFEEAPVFGKRVIFIYQAGEEEAQVAQCVICSKWRRLPVHALISANWACAENVWDTDRSSCSAPEEMNLRDTDFSRTNKEHKKQKKKQKTSGGRAPEEGEPSGLDALANAAALGYDVAGAGDPATGPTTRHPRHRPGCTCIVCIQPPSGKGRHEPSCKCNVCLTVKRRFKTLMLRKKKRQSENNNNNDDGEKDQFAGKQGLEITNEVDSMEEVGKAAAAAAAAGLDLNSDPHRDDEIVDEASADFPLHVYLCHSGLPGFVPGPCMDGEALCGGDGKSRDGGGGGENSRAVG